MPQSRQTTPTQSVASRLGASCDLWHLHPYDGSFPYPLGWDGRKAEERLLALAVRRSMVSVSPLDVAPPSGVCRVVPRVAVPRRAFHCDSLAGVWGCQAGLDYSHRLPLIPGSGAFVAVLRLGALTDLVDRRNRYARHHLAYTRVG